MESEELERLATDADWHPPFTNLGAEMYGAGYVWRRYGFYPKWLPLWIEATHSLNQYLMPSTRELECFYRNAFVYVKRFKDIYDKRSRSVCFHIPSPFVLYKRLTGVTQTKDCQGTVVFYAHSLNSGAALVDLEEYIAELKALPEEMQPVTVCLHYLDVNYKLHEKLIENGITCVTAGNGFHNMFIPRFYEIIKRHKYAIANSWSSALLYCVDLGLPSSVYGIRYDFEIPSAKAVINKQDTTLDWYIYLMERHWDWLVDVYKVGKVADAPIQTRKQRRFSALHQARIDYKDDNLLYISETFTGLNREITAEQKRIADIELGNDVSISRIKLSFLFYQSLLTTPFFFVYRLLTDKVERYLLYRMFIDKIKRRNTA